MKIHHLNCGTLCPYGGAQLRSLQLFFTLLQKGRTRSKQWFSLLVTLAGFFLVILLATYSFNPGSMLESVEKNVTYPRMLSSSRRLKACVSSRA